VRERALGGATVLSHPELELRDETGQTSRRGCRSRYSASTQMREEVPCCDAYDGANAAASNPTSATTSTATEVPLEYAHDILVDGLHGNISTIQPRSKVHDRSNQ